MIQHPVSAKLAEASELQRTKPTLWDRVTLVNIIPFRTVDHNWPNGVEAE